jgi:hypothetical protein
MAAVWTVISTVCSAVPAIAKRVQRFIAGVFAWVRANATSVRKASAPLMPANACRRFRATGRSRN